MQRRKRPIGSLFDFIGNYAILNDTVSLHASIQLSTETEYELIHSTLDLEKKAVGIYAPFYNGK